MGETTLEENFVTSKSRLENKDDKQFCDTTTDEWTNSNGLKTDTADQNDYNVFLKAGCGQNKFYVSFNFLVKHFGYFTKRNSLANIEEDLVLPLVSEAALQNMIDFIEKGKLSFFNYVDSV